MIKGILKISHRKHSPLNSLLHNPRYPLANVDITFTSCKILHFYERDAFKYNFSQNVSFGKNFSKHAFEKHPLPPIWNIIRVQKKASEEGLIEKNCTHRLRRSGMEQINPRQNLKLEFIHGKHWGSSTFCLRLRLLWKQDVANKGFLAGIRVLYNIFCTVFFFSFYFT